LKHKLLAAWWGVGVLFLCHGLIVATWVSRIPAVQTTLGLQNGVLGLTLLGSAIGAVTTIPFAGWLVSRYGAKTLSVAAGVLFALSLILPGLAFNAATLAAALFVFGAMAASMDVSMNALGVELEKVMGNPTMSRFHGMFSLGGMAGAGVGGALATHGMRPPLHFMLSAVVLAVMVGLSWPLLLETHDYHATGDHRLPWNKIPPVLVALSAIGFCILLAEGAMADWTAVYLKQVLHSGPGMAAASYSVFSAAMAIFRFLGDIITARLGPIRTVATGSLVAAAGLVWALSMPQPAWSLPGFALTGAGFSVIIPLVFGSGGRVPGVKAGPGIATVTGIGYIGFIVGPPLIGFASQLFTLRYALGVVVACCLVSAYLSRSMKQLA
jgi:MFS family permease